VHAGGQFAAPLASITKKGWEAVIANCLTGGFLCARECYTQWMAEHGGLLSADDFAAYQPVLREPLVTTYRGRTIVGFPPPSSGGVHVAQILNILENFDVEAIYRREVEQLAELSLGRRIAGRRPTRRRRSRPRSRLRRLARRPPADGSARRGRPWRTANRCAAPMTTRRSACQRSYAVCRFSHKRGPFPQSFPILTAISGVTGRGFRRAMMRCSV
jgi:hypothetical protein